MRKAGRGVLASALLLLWACGDEPTGPVDAGGGLSLHVTMAPGAPARVDQGRIRIEGPTPRTVTVAPGETVTVEGLTPGTYTVALEGLVGGDVDSYGQTEGVTVTAGADARVAVTMRSFVPTVQALPVWVRPADTVSVSFGRVVGAESYVVESAPDPGFGAPTSLATPDTTAVLVPASPGRLYVRVRAVNRFGSTSVPGPVESVDAVEALSGPIEGRRDLSSDRTYLIEGTLTVGDGDELRIPAGTLLMGRDSLSVLIVDVGGQIYSEGTRENPVVFTSSRPPGERGRRDWWGLVVNGRSPCNGQDGQCVDEFWGSPYGGQLPGDDSGAITYTRIEFAFTALALNGVGSGTQLHHVQAHHAHGDGFKWSGGSVDLKFAVATGVRDDGFDLSDGWQGRGQFWIVQQSPDAANGGLEVENVNRPQRGFDSTPRTRPTVYNATLIGKGPGGAGGTPGQSTLGLHLRRGTEGFLHNVLVQGFGQACFDVDDQETKARLDAGSLNVTHSILFDCATLYDPDGDVDLEAIFEDADRQNRVGVDPGVVDAYDRDDPDWTLAAGAPARSGFATPPADGFFEPAAFVGGAGDQAWWEGWITTAER